MDIYLEIVLTPSTDVIPDDAKSASRKTLGDIIQGGRADKGATLIDGEWVPNSPIGAKRTGILYITDVPSSTVPKIRRLMAPHIGLQDGDEDSILLLSKFAFRVNQMPSNARQRFIRDRYITTTWTNARPLLGNKPANRVVNDGDLDG